METLCVNLYVAITELLCFLVHPVFLQDARVKLSYMVLFGDTVFHCLS